MVACPLREREAARSNRADPTTEAPDLAERPEEPAWTPLIRCGAAKAGVRRFRASRRIRAWPTEGRRLAAVRREAWDRGE